MKNLFALVLLLISLFMMVSCGSAQKTLKYGFLPGGDYQYYAPNRPVDLKGRQYNLNIIDDRNGNRISCSDMILPRDTELEGYRGLSFFTHYLKAMIKSNNGTIDPTAGTTVNVKLKGLSGELRAAVYGHVYGLVEFEVDMEGLNKTYCSSMVDGDPDAPVGKFSVDTRKGAFRKLVSGSTRRALEAFMHDLVYAQK